MARLSIEQIASRFRSEIRSLLLRLAVSRVLAAVLVSLATLVFLDWFLQLGKMGRAVSLAVFAGVVIVTVVREIVRPLRHTWTDGEVLAYLDSVDPEARDLLVNLRELRNPDGVAEGASAEGAAFLQAALEDLERRAEAFRMGSTLKRDAARKWLLAAIVLAALAATGAVAFKSEVGIGLARLFMPFANIRWSAFTTLLVEEPETGWRIPQGESLSVVTRVEGQRPLELTLSLKSQNTDYWITEQVPVREDGSAEYVFESVGEPVTFYVSGGDDESERYTLEVVEKPRLKNITAYYEYPSYAGLENQQLASGQLRGLEGTKVRLVFESSKHLREARFELKGEPEELLTLDSPTTFSKELLLRQDGAYTVKLTDELGFREYRPESYAIEVVPDELPVATIVAPGKDLVATSQAQLKIAFRATDDFGLTSVRFMHALGSGAEPASLSDHVTGPIPQSGKAVEPAPFEWDLSKLNLKGSAMLEYFVFVKDCNPTGRGASESEKFKINVLKPSDFHLQILYEAKKVLTEAQLAYRNQKGAYHKGEAWSAQSANGEPGDSKWQELLDLQESSYRASQALGRWLTELNEHIERNRMQDDFMKARLAIIEGLWQAVAAEVLATRVDFVNASPKTAAAAAPEQLKATRLKTISDSRKRQETAVVGLGQLLRKMYDWENLQTVLVNTRILLERQAEIGDRSKGLVQSTIGKDIEDLDDALLAQVLTLGQQQTSALDAEGSLENELATLALKADKDGRKVTRHHLLLALTFLKDRKINALLGSSVKKINNNQISDVIGEQAGACSALEIVKGLLVKAGQDTQVEPLDLAALLAPDALESRVDVEDVKAEVAAEEGGEAMTVDPNDPRLKPVQPVGDDALSQALLMLAELQRGVLSRTAHLEEQQKTVKSSRYKDLKVGMLNWKLKQAREHAEERVIPLVEESEYRDQLKPQVENLRERMEGVTRLLSGSVLTESSRSLQEDIGAASEELAHYMARQKQFKELAADHESRAGKDEFNRLYLVRGEDLKRSMDLVRALDLSLTMQASVNRQSEWIKRASSGEAPRSVEELKPKVAESLARSQEAIAKQIEHIQELSAGMGEAVKGRAEALGLGKLADHKLAQAAQEIGTGKVDDALRQRQEDASRNMEGLLARMRELLDEREAQEQPTQPLQVAEAAADGSSGEQPAAEKKFKTADELSAELKPESIRQSISSSTAISAEVKDRLLKQLPGEFPVEQGTLLGAYYRSLLEIEEGASGGQTR